MAFTCGRHRAFVKARGGESVIGEATPLLAVKWQRIRDDISTATVTLPTWDCCDLLSQIGTVRNELHIERNGAPVWQGVITRIEFQADVTQLFAEDILWVAKRSTVEAGYNHSYPNIGNVIDDMHWQIVVQCFYKNHDPWRMTGAYGGANHLFPIHWPDHADDPREARIVFPYSMSTWEDFDKYGEDYGADYTVINRDVYYWDIHLQWKTIPPLDEEFISEAPRIVEYGNQLATRTIVTNGKGYAGMASASAYWRGIYGYVDNLITNVTESSVVDGPPEQKDVEEWMRTAQRDLIGKQPSPTAIVIPANTTLLPGSPWNIDDLFPGAWFQVSVDRLCRSLTEWQRLHEIIVEETASGGESTQFTAVAAPTGGALVVLDG